MRVLVHVAFLVAALLAAPLRGASAGDPVAPDFEKSLQRCRELVAGEQWPAGEAALRKLFTDFPKDPRVRARLREIEEGLKVCLFRKGRPAPTGKDLFGIDTVAFNASTRDIEISSSSLVPPLWTPTEDGISVLTPRLEGPLTVRITGSMLDAQQQVLILFLCLDLEKRGGYAIVPGFVDRNATESLVSATKVLRISSTSPKELTLRAASAECSSRTGAIVTRSGGEIVIKNYLGDVVARASDSSYTNGYVGLKSAGRASVYLKGRVERRAYLKTVAEHFAALYAAWEAESYQREALIPEWARDSVVAAPDMTLSELPSDAPPEDRFSLTALVEAAADGDEEEALHADARSLEVPKRTALYLRGVADIAFGSHRTACDALDELVAAEPDFVPARMFRGIARFHLRQMDEAKSDLAWALERRPRASHAVVARAILAIYEQDYAGAEAALAKADELGVSGDSLDEIRDWVHRARVGPKFTQRFEHATEHFVVVSDHSKQICVDAATLLETMQPLYTTAIGAAPPRAAKARVYVFSGPEGYLDYTDDLYVSADSTAGVYLPMLRELALWVPLDMNEFKDTVRHEGFHQYLHRLTDEAPDWFNEGYASVMGSAGPDGVRNKARDAEFVAGFVPVRELVAMKHREFMAKAGVMYTESRYLVDFLRRTNNSKLKKVLRDYLAAVAGGLSQAEANEKVLGPVMDLLEAEFKGSL